jgi:hypothetical protein
VGCWGLETSFYLRFPVTWRLPLHWNLESSCTPLPILRRTFGSNWVGTGSSRRLSLGGYSNVFQA